MPNKSLEELMEVRGIDPNSEKADIIRKKCSFLSPVSKSDFEFILSRLENGNSDKATKKKLYTNKTNSDQEISQLKVELLKYEKAIGYVVKKAPQLDAAMLVANVNPFKENSNEFYYTVTSLDHEVAKARRLNLYQKEY